MRKLFFALFLVLCFLFTGCHTMLSLIKNEEIKKDVLIRFLYVENNGYSRTDGSYKLNKYPPSGMELYSVIFRYQNNSDNIVPYNFKDSYLLADQVLYPVITSNFSLIGELESKKGISWIIFHIFFYLPEGKTPSKLILSNLGEYYLPESEWRKVFF